MYLPMKFHDDALQGQEQVFYVVAIDEDLRDTFSRLSSARELARNLLLQYPKAKVQVFKVFAYADCVTA